MSEIIPADEHAFLGFLVVKRIPGSVTGGAWTKAIIAASGASVAGVANRAADSNVAGFRRHPNAGGVLAVVRVLIIGPDERRAGGVVLLFPPLVGSGIIDQIVEFPLFQVLVFPTALPLLPVELLGSQMRLAIIIGNGRIKFRGIPANVPLHVHQKNQFVTGINIRAEIKGDPHRGIGAVSPTTGRPDLPVVHQDLRQDTVAGKWTRREIHGKRFVGVELPRLLRVQRFTLELP